MRSLPHLLGQPEHVFFIDPPYAVNGKGPGLRLYRYSSLDHEKLFGLLAESECPWIATYHSSRDIRQLARSNGFRITTVGMHTTHHRRRRELLLSKWKCGKIEEPECGRGGTGT